MKNFKTIALALIVSVGTFNLSAQTKKIKVAESTINWTGKKVTGEHKGTIKFKEGSLEFKGKELKGGKFIVDMNTINTTDLDGEWKGKLDGHLKNDDFFGVTKYPTALLVFKRIAPKSGTVYTVIADLTIKGITKPVTFDIDLNKGLGTAKVVIDRTKYDIKYGSGSFFDNLGDKTISDNFDLDIVLKY